jgi:hypothetical protein
VCFREMHFTGRLCFKAPTFVRPLLNRVTKSQLWSFCNADEGCFACFGVE